MYILLCAQYNHTLSTVATHTATGTVLRVKVNLCTSCYAWHTWTITAAVVPLLRDLKSHLSQKRDVAGCLIWWVIRN